MAREWLAKSLTSSHTCCGMQAPLPGSSSRIDGAEKFFASVNDLQQAGNIVS
jgi:hypothetical protein